MVWLAFGPFLAVCAYFCSFWPVLGFAIVAFSRPFIGLEVVFVKSVWPWCSGFTILSVFIFFLPHFYELAGSREWWI